MRWKLSKDLFLSILLAECSGNFLPNSPEMKGATDLTIL